MPRIAALGEAARVRNLALGGALVLGAEDEEAVRAAWESLPGDVAIVILTPGAARSLGERATARTGVFPVVLDA